MNFSKITPNVISILENIVGKANLYLDQTTLDKYAKDETEDLEFPPEVVVKPANTNEISEILKLANKENVPVTPIGARTGLSGGALSIYGGIGLSLERLNKILEIDEKTSKQPLSQQ